MKKITKSVYYVVGMGGEWWGAFFLAMRVLILIHSVIFFSIFS